jgi:hypothetical protein
MTTAYTSLLGLALPVTGELSGTWGDTVNTAITSLLDTAIAGTTSITTDASAADTPITPVDVAPAVDVPVTSGECRQPADCGPAARGGHLHCHSQRPHARGGRPWRWASRNWKDPEATASL